MATGIPTVNATPRQPFASQIPERVGSVFEKGKYQEQQSPPGPSSTPPSSNLTAFASGSPLTLQDADALQAELLQNRFEQLLPT